MNIRAIRSGHSFILSSAALALFSFLSLFLLACASTPEPNTPVPRNEPAATTIPVARSGQEVFTSICSACHGLQGQGQPNWHIPNENGSLPAPPLNGDGHTWHHGDGFLYRVVRDGGKFQEDPVLLPNFKSAMPAFGAQLSHEEIVAVIAYIKEWWDGKSSRGLSIVEAQANKSIGDPFPDG